MSTLNLICAGAAQGLVKALQEGFAQATGAQIHARFGAVGAMKEALLAGEPCDVLVLTQTLVEGLVADGRMAADSVVPLGRVRTGVAVRAGTAWPDVGTPAALTAALLGASGLYVPDTVRSTAGQHVARVLRELGVAEAMAGRLREYPNGATAMREMAATAEPAPIGCTQVTEIKYTPGVELVALLPREFELATLYTAAVAADSPQAALARQFVALLTGAESAALRRAGGFDD
jgi:molybdate transport system substrate-binding protein